MITLRTDGRTIYPAVGSTEVENCKVPEGPAQLQRPERQNQPGRPKQTETNKQTTHKIHTSLIMN